MGGARPGRCELTDKMEMNILGSSVLSQSAISDRHACATHRFMQLLAVQSFVFPVAYALLSLLLWMDVPSFIPTDTCVFHTCVFHLTDETTALLFLSNVALRFTLRAVLQTARSFLGVN